MTNADELTALVVDIASGAASAGQALVWDAHTAMRPRSIGMLALAEAIGSVVMEDGADSALQPPRPPTVLSREATEWSRATIALARKHPDAVRWRGPFFGVSTLKLPVDGLHLIRLSAGAILPEHGHQDEETTLVLSGAFEDELGGYEPGDIAFAGAELAHAPRALRGADCVCLVLSEGRMLFRGLLEKAAGRLLWD